jgi:apolipoprotein N-acyltransferase
VLYEFTRYYATFLYDGSGLTFFSLGQFLPLGGLQLASVGGIWLLTFVTALLIWLIVSVFHVGSTRTRSIACVASFGLLAIPVFAGDGMIYERDSEEEAVIMTVPFPVSFSSISAVKQFASDPRLIADEESLTILGPETMLELRLIDGAITFNRPQDEPWKEVSTTRNCSVLIGAWIIMENRDDRINAIVQIREGEVVGVEPKHRLAPFVESQPFGTGSLVEMGWIPEDAVRDATLPGAANERLRCFTKPQGIQTGVCYDIFFGAAYLDGLNVSHDFMTCSLDESYDFGVFQWLSIHHSQIRAIETCRSLVRCSLGGITAAFDPNGREIQPMISRAGMNLYRVPVCHETSFYAQAGDWIVWFSLVVVSGWMAYGICERRFKRVSIDEA